MKWHSLFLSVITKITQTLVPLVYQAVNTLFSEVVWMRLEPVSNNVHDFAVATFQCLFQRTKDVKVTWGKIGAVWLVFEHCLPKLHQLFQCASGYRWPRIVMEQNHSREQQDRPLGLP
ncbi:hypothetical protein AVEN_156550-1 [Araneus ventricosus]|uniref:Uncharacterized protein n=1 Tax=Araneus ventricosus TaxID=182803 RepID=A0A4Y2P9J2_ARAVE|nr:hypothetical protein AVEN_156550-1 [Araneus ventricosus]